MPTTFNVAVTGDTGLDVYTEYVMNYETADRRVRDLEATYDVDVPSGAAFTALVTSTLLGGNQAIPINIEYLQPAEVYDALKKKAEAITLQKYLVELGEFSDEHSNNMKVLRVTKRRPIVDKYSTLCKVNVFDDLVNDEGKMPTNNNYDLLIIHDGDGCWRKYPNGPDTGDAIKLVNDVLARDSGGRQGFRIIVNLNHDLPDVERGPNGLNFGDQAFFWNKLAKCADKICVICSVNMLRREGASISRRLSWEQTIEDVATELLLFDKLHVLARFKHVIIRFGTVAALHIMSVGKNRTADVVFAPLANAGIYRDPVEDGTVEGQNVFLVAAIAKMIASQNGSECNRMMFANAMKSGLLASMRAFDYGYRIRWETPERSGNLEAGKQIIVDMLKRSPCTLRDCSVHKAIDVDYDKLNPADYTEQQTLGEASVPCDVLDRPPSSLPGQLLQWELLKNTINGPGRIPAPVGTEGVSRINIGIAIVLFGLDKVLNRQWNSGNPGDNRIIDILRRPELVMSTDEEADHKTLPLGKLPVIPVSSRSALPAKSANVSPLYTPVMKLGRLTVVERLEIEGFRSIHNLLKNYLEQSARVQSPSPPISIAVFGPPGSGKSFAVKEIARHINSTISPASQKQRHILEPVEYNVAQFRSVEDLGEAIIRASVINNEGKIPLVFFDEFDCEFGGAQLGWLKYFLAPMQDGMFYGARQTIKIARAIFVFAGGVYSKFQDFDPASGSPAVGELLRSQEVRAKLNAFAIQKGPDFVSRLRGHINILPLEAIGDKTIKPIVRRAIIIRGILEKREFAIKGRANNYAYIDEDIVYALLTMDRYRHGARSLEAIIQMCTPKDGKIEKASLPSRSQMDMHINSDEFFIRMFRSRFRQNIASETASQKVKGIPANEAGPLPPPTSSDILSELQNEGGSDANVNQSKPETTGEGALVSQ